MKTRNFCEECWATTRAFVPAEWLIEERYLCTTCARAACGGVEDLEMVGLRVNQDQQQTLRVAQGDAKKESEAAMEKQFRCTCSPDCTALCGKEGGRARGHHKKTGASVGVKTGKGGSVCATAVKSRDQHKNKPSNGRRNTHSASRATTQPEQIRNSVATAHNVAELTVSGGMVRVELNATPEFLDKWWSGLTLSEKGEMLASAIGGRVL